MDDKIGVTLNEMHQLEKDFLLYGEFDINSTKSIMELLDSLHKKTSTVENILEIKETEWNIRFLLSTNGPAVYSQMTQLYIDNLKEKYIRLYEALVTELRLLLRSIAILSKGYLPPQYVPSYNTSENFRKSHCHDERKEPGLCSGPTPY